MNTPSPQSVSKRYARPPITERAIRVYADIPEDVFQEKLEEWADVVRNEFPFYHRKVEWKLLIASQGDLPVIDPGKSTMLLRHRYWSCDPAKGHADWCLQLLRDSFILNMRRRPSPHQDTRSFTDLLTFFKAWLPRWLETFRPVTVQRVGLEYWNMLNRVTLPGLASDKSIQAAEVLNVFANTPRPRNAVHYTPPYDCTHSWLAKINGQEFGLRAETKSVDVTPIALQVHLAADTVAGNMQDILAAIEIEHDLLSDTFDIFFTTKAKEVFGVMA